MLAFTFTCPKCGSDQMEHVTQSVPARGINLNSSAIVRCECRYEWQMVVSFALVGHASSECKPTKGIAPSLIEHGARS